MLHHRLRAASGAIKTGGGGGGIDPLGDDFVLIVDTTLPGASTTVYIPFLGPYNVTIDWGDGNSEYASGTSTDVTHIYSSDGEYTITVSGTAFQYANKSSAYRAAWKECLAIGRLGNDLTNMFINAVNLTSLPSVIPSGKTNMLSMLRGALLINSDISAWDVSDVTNMARMLYQTSSFDQDLSGWCVQHIASEPIYFALGSALSPEHYPVWGTCPS